MLNYQKVITAFQLAVDKLIVNIRIQGNAFVNIEIGNLHAPVATDKAAFGGVSPKIVRADIAVADPFVTNAEREIKKINQKPVGNEVDMSFCVDSSSGSYTVTVTNKVTGEIIRKLDFKGLSVEVFDSSKLAGHLIDIKG